MRHISWLSTLLVVALLSLLMAQADPIAPPESNVTTDSAARDRSRPIAWQPCHENAAFECGMFTLPVDYAQPRGETFELSVIRAPARDPKT
ncbi:MAG: hypothetical protein HGA45_07605 [Chloroflexales bacterium]|nr:hypothetical protein [Chloroflexales bacterium]